MSNKAINWALEIPLKGGQKSILMFLANAINKEGVCFPNTETLMRWSGYSRRSVIQYVNDLVDEKIINRKYQHNQKGWRKKTIYSLNFDLKVEQISDKILNANIAPSCGKLTNLSANTAYLSAIFAYLSAVFAFHTIENRNINHNNNHCDFSLVDNFSEQTEQAKQTKIITMLSLKFRQMVKINGDSMNLHIAEKIFTEECLKADHPIERADHLILIRQSQVDETNAINDRGEFVPAICNLRAWLEGRRWNDIIKSIGAKKKVSRCVKCKTCGEEYLKGSYCKVCVERAKPRMMEIAAHA